MNYFDIAADWPGDTLQILFDEFQLTQEQWVCEFYRSARGSGYAYYSHVAPCRKIAQFNQYDCFEEISRSDLDLFGEP